MGPASRRQVLSPETLAAFGASPIYSSSNSASDLHGGDRNSSAPSQFSKYFATTNTSVENPIIGIKIGGWTICTQNSSIGDEQKMEALTELLEEIANSTEDANDDVQSQAVVRQRRLCPPEITFLDAFISLRHDGSDAGYDDDNTTKASEIRFNATDALSEWAEAHQFLESRPVDESEHDTRVSSSLLNQRKKCRGVTILRTLDAKVWSNKSKRLTDDTASDSGDAAANSSEFYYDWTFSSPYAGTILTSSSDSSNNYNIDLINNRQQWQPLPKSQIPFHLLQDTSQPILLYDDIHLFEDDLHDNGESSLNIKIRVMPKCWYVLQRLYVRVDYVCVKCREVRYFCLLDENDVVTNASATKTGSVGNSCKPNVVYRDVTWREASWTELGKMSLPVDPSAWIEHNISGSGVIGGNFSTTSTGVPSFASLLAKLPLVTPPDLEKHALFIAGLR
ncbi:hypothetical protein ACHAWT_009789 [Skeletonema menzelii]